MNLLFNDNVKEKNIERYLKHSNILKSPVSVRKLYTKNFLNKKNLTELSKNIHEHIVNKLEGTMCQIYDSMDETMDKILDVTNIKKDLFLSYNLFEDSKDYALLFHNNNNILNIYVRHSSLARDNVIKKYLSGEMSLDKICLYFNIEALIPACISSIISSYIYKLSYEGSCLIEDVTSEDRSAYGIVDTYDSGLKIFSYNNILGENNFISVNDGEKIIDINPMGNQLIGNSIPFDIRLKNKKMTGITIGKLKTIGRINSITNKIIRI